MGEIATAIRAAATANTTTAVRRQRAGPPATHPLVAACLYASKSTRASSVSSDSARSEKLYPTPSFSETETARCRWKRGICGRSRKPSTDLVSVKLSEMCSCGFCRRTTATSHSRTEGSYDRPRIVVMRRVCLWELRMCHTCLIRSEFDR